jgi:predicted negative regulator of RcsB-dependent stress response
MYRKIIPFLIIVFLTHLSAKANFDFNPNCIKAYQAIMQLKLNEAKVLISKEKQQNPNNGITLLLDNYVDYFTILTSESKADYDRLKKNRSTRLDQLQEQNTNSPYYLFAQAEIDIQWALLQGKFQDYFSAALNINRADDLLKENISKYPSFLLNKKGAALLNIVLGAVPSYLRGFLKTFGLSGNVQNGVRDLENLIATLPKTNYYFYRDEVIFFYALAEIEAVKNKNNHQKIMAQLVLLSNQSLIKNYLEGYVSSKNFHNDDAINYLLNSPQGSQYKDFPAIDYLIGSAKINKMDNDAQVYLLKYLKEYRGLNFIKDAYLKLAYYYLVRGDNDKFHSYIKLVRSQGNILIEKDKQALKEANDNVPNLDLLKARFYFDGGYYSKALAELKNKNADSFKLVRDKIEFYYRLGRIYDESQRDSSALVNYQKAINLGKTSTYYFAANAALCIGEIFEERKDKIKARNFYNQAIDMKHHEYQNSIESKAKEGLKRLE